MLSSFQGTYPKVSDSAFILETAMLIGNVEVGGDSSVWFYSILRGDIHYIRIGERTNIQDHCVVHVTKGLHPVVIGNDVSVGHRAVLHGCTVEDEVLIGMGSIIMDQAVIGKGSIVGSGTLVTEGKIIPPGSLVIGSPGRVKRSVTREESDWVRQSALNYVEYARLHRESGL